jgi:hypothetical protein
MKSHQSHPGLNAFQMAFSKWFIIPIFSIYVWKYLSNYENVIPKNELIIDDDESSKIYTQKIQISNQHNKYLFLTIFFNFFTLSQLYVQLTILFLTPDHALMESVVFQIVYGLIGIFIFFTLLVSNFKKFFNKIKSID